MYKIDQPIHRETADTEKQQPRANPEGRFPGEIDIIFALEHLQEIIDTGSDDHQAVEAIVQGLEDLELLHQENIDDKNQWKSDQAI